MAPSAPADKHRFRTRREVAGAGGAKHIQNILTSRTYLGHMVHDGAIVARDVHEAAVDEET